MVAVVAEMGKMFAAQTEANRLATLEAIREANKPTAKEIREEEEAQKKEDRIKAFRLTQLENARKEAELQASKATGCSHSSYNPATGITKHGWRGQVHTPHGEKPYFVPTCTLCNYQIKDDKGNPLHFPATVEMLSNGVNLDQYIALDLEKLKTWYKQTIEQVA